MTREIQLTQGKVALVDDADYEWLNQYGWCASWSGRRWYAVHREGRRSILMHRLILGLSNPSIQGDHKSGNGLDNRRENLRPATNAQNQANRIKYRGSSMFKGVAWNKRQHDWECYIKKDGKRTFLGRFKDEIKAALAYNEAAGELFGEYALLNRVSEQVSG